MYAWYFCCCVWDLAMRLLWKSSSGLWKRVAQKWPEHAYLCAFLFYPYIVMILLLRKGFLPSQPDNCEFPLELTLGWDFSPDFSCFLSWFLFVKQQWGSSVDVITRVLFTCDSLLIFYESLHLFWLSLCIIIAEEKNTIEYSVCLTSSVSFTCCPSEREW